MPAHQRHITLVHSIAAQGLVQVTQHAALLGDHQQARGIAIEAMYQLQVLGIRAQLAKRLDHPITQAAAAMHGDAGWLVQHNQRLVFVDNRRLQALQQPLGQWFRLIALSQAQGRHANDIARLQLVLRLDAPFVHAHFAFTQNAVNQRLGHTLELGAKKIIDALAGKFRRNLK
ncbi:hypothetical protein D9M68_836980 [compost metagenome]